MKHLKEESTYEASAREFMEKTQTTMLVQFLYHGPHFEDDKDQRDVYQITLRRKNYTYIFKFGQSINKSGNSKGPVVMDCPSHCKDWGHCRTHIRKRTAPTDYDVLTCLTKYDPGTFDDFCSEYGYDTDSRKAEKTYFSVQAEFANVQKLFGDVIDELAEIQ